jgi:hypothetical protein
LVGWLVDSLAGWSIGMGVRASCMCRLCFVEGTPRSSHVTRPPPTHKHSNTQTHTPTRAHTHRPKVLSVSEMSKVILSLVARTATHTTRKLCKRQGWESLAARFPEVKVYTPDFSRCVDFYCVHAGGRGVLDGVEKNLRLTPRHLEPSRQTLYQYGNTSSSSIWYEMEYIVRHMDLKRGQRVLQVAFGSGFKCNSAVWVSLHV